MQNADDEIVRLVEELVKLHVSGNTVILVALPMSGTSLSCDKISNSSRLISWCVLDDIENQKAMRLAENADPFGTRTIGESICLHSHMLCLK